MVYRGCRLPPSPESCVDYEARRLQTTSRPGFQLWENYSVCFLRFRWGVKTTSEAGKCVRPRILGAAALVPAFCLPYDRDSATTGQFDPAEENAASSGASQVHWSLESDAFTASPHGTNKYIRISGLRVSDWRKDKLLWCRFEIRVSKALSRERAG